MFARTKKSFLIVDPDDESRFDLKAALLGCRASVRDTRCGEEAIEMLVEEPADIVIVDAHPLTTTGLEVAHVIKDAYNGWPSTDVILVSDRSRSDTWNIAATGWQMGCAMFEKPLTVAQLGVWL